MRAGERAAAPDIDFAHDARHHRGRQQPTEQRSLQAGRAWGIGVCRHLLIVELLVEHRLKRI